MEITLPLVRRASHPALPQFQLKARFLSQLVRPVGNRDEYEEFQWGAVPVTSTDLVHLDPALKIIKANWLIYLLCGGPAVVGAARSETTGGENEEEGR